MRTSACSILLQLEAVSSKDTGRKAACGTHSHAPKRRDTGSVLFFSLSSSNPVLWRVNRLGNLVARDEQHLLDV